MAEDTEILADSGVLMEGVTTTTAAAGAIAQKRQILEQGLSLKLVIFYAH